MNKRGTGAIFWQINDFWRVHFHYLLDDGIISDQVV
jgi:hypothetical protein